MDYWGGGGGAKVMLPPPSKIIGGGGRPPAPSSYAYDFANVSFIRTGRLSDPCCTLSCYLSIQNSYVISHAYLFHFSSVPMSGNNFRRHRTP